MRPTGALHLGHYHGVLKNWIGLQPTNECLFFIADWHALTTHYESPQGIPGHTREMLIDWLAAGVDPRKATLFVQSHVPEHAELHLLLSMMTPLSWLERVPTYKDQQEKLTGKDLSTYGFLGYPLLQSADILIYQADAVPVGEDQVPHIELTREVARRVNHLTQKPLFREPKALLTPASRMPGLDGQKMSKSYDNTIGLREDPDTVSKKIKTMPTDPARVRKTDPGSPDACPVWPLHQIYSDEPRRDWVRAGCTSASIGCIECKKPLIDAVIAEQEPIHARARAYAEDPARLHEILADGADRARGLAGKTLRAVRETMGLGR